MASFHGFLLTFMGGGFLTLFYRAVLEDGQGILLVEAAEGLPEGFVAGVLEQSGFYGRLLQTRKWRFAAASLWPLLRRPSIAPQLLRALRRPEESRRAAAPACLMSLGVDPAAQGRGLGAGLVSAFAEACRVRGERRFALTTDQEENEKVNRFYERCGLRLVRSYRTPEGRTMNEYLYEGRDEPR
jgi:GNAT superfamily N-acetyltransferase